MLALPMNVELNPLTLEMKRFKDERDQNNEDQHSEMKIQNHQPLLSLLQGAAEERRLTWQWPFSLVSSQPVLTSALPFLSFLFVPKLNCYG